MPDPVVAMRAVADRLDAVGLRLHPRLLAGMLRSANPVT
jgi:hypothetical protein